MNDGRKSAIYTGWVRHRRFVPSSHSFTYPMFMLYLDLDELPSLFESKWYCSLNRFNLVSVKRADYFAPEQADLKQAVIDEVTESLERQGLNVPEIGAVRMLTHARYMNYIFNPVTLYYLFDRDEELCAVLAEITNTPWDERHHYVLPVGQSGQYGVYQCKGKNRHVFEFEKAFHVSPFNPMNMMYKWVFAEPDKSLRVHMDNHLISDQEKHFDATLVMERKSLEADLAKTLIRFPLMTVSVSMGIYRQALKLWLKKMPFYDHPRYVETAFGQEETPK